MISLSGVWQHEAGRFGALAVRKHLAWLGTTDQLRAERLRQARLLFSGNHRQFYVEEKRSKQTYRPLAEGLPDFYEPLNLLGLMSRKFGDLLFGERPRIKCEDPAAQEAIDRIAKRSWLPATLIDAATEASWAGETYLEVTRPVSVAFITRVPADEVFPVGLPGPNHQFDEYVRYATAESGGERLLLETRFSAGLIERRLFTLEGDRDLIRGQDLTRPAADGRQPETLDRWPIRRNGQPLRRVETTNLSVPSLVRIPNEAAGLSDYDGLLDAQDSVNAKHTQLARVIAKHSDPRLAVPEHQATPTGDAPAPAEVFFFRSKDDIPQAIVWNAELGPASEDRRFALAAWSMLAEMPLSLLGLKDDSTAETAAKVRLNAVPALSRAQRKALFFAEGIAMAMSLALRVEGMRVEPDAIAIEMRDGLPDDPEARANEIATLRAAGAISIRRSLEKQYLEPAAIQAELAELQAESRSQTPATLLGEGPSASLNADPSPNAAQSAGDQ